MKRIFCAFLALVLSMSVAFPLNAFAAGEGNLDGGGGGMGVGSSTSSWSAGNEGVRATVVRASDHAAVTAPIDFTNKAPSAGIYHFGKVSKIQYSGGRGLSPVRGGYAYVKPSQAIPRIISTGGTNNIAALKRYFCSEYFVKLLANQTGMSYEALIGGAYKILIEPIAYYKFEGVMIATTATEAALYDEVCNRLLYLRMNALTHKNLPLSMFLEVSDLGYPAWSGSRSGIVSNVSIKSSLGLGVVRFEEQPEDLGIAAYDYEYRTNTEVITAVRISGGQSDPDNAARVSFSIMGATYTVGNVYYPDGDSQLAWVRWTTPDTPQSVTITVSVSGPGNAAKTTLQCKIVDLDENPPPNPVADDRNDGFTPVAIPEREQKTSASWGIWTPRWRPDWVWHSDMQWEDDGHDEDCPENCGESHGHWEDNGYWCDHGWWEFDYHSYSAGISGSMSITPDSKNPTASGRTMKSGYGINETASAGVSTNQSSAVTPVQNAVSYFSEFGFDTYWRLLEGRGGSFEFKPNEYSTYRSRTHFTPIWYPDGSYTVNTWIIDCWTPDGMLCLNLSDSLTVSGSLWDDWHVAAKTVN